MVVLVLADRIPVHVPHVSVVSFVARDHTNARRQTGHRQKQQPCIYKTPQWRFDRAPCAAMHDIAVEAPT